LNAALERHPEIAVKMRNLENRILRKGVIQMRDPREGEKSDDVEAGCSDYEQASDRDPKNWPDD